MTSALINKIILFSSSFRFAAAIFTASLLFGCAGTIEDNAWLNGVSREDALAIRSALQTEKKAHDIYSYERDEDGSILVRSNVGDFKARRVRGRWIFVPMVITS
jgi:hypothetical protein